ncbi:hypothetical protein F4781DRAFT_441429 [Annulohypoxylon bovei var. microspora]|nr:hypothetical protein F4781DRAFT_441429 [Annulohypoxylon bovei var. microspora]
MARESKRTDRNRSRGENEDVKEPQAAQVSKKQTERQHLIDRVKDGFPGMAVARSIKGEIKSIINESRGRRSSVSQRLAGNGSASRRSSLSEKGKVLLKKHVNLSRSRQDARPKQKDPLHQWMVENSGGTVREKG